MNSLFEYLFTSSWLLLLLMLGYLIFLENQKLLIFKRLYLMGSLLLCLLHPLLRKINSLLSENFAGGSSLAFLQAEQYLPEVVLSAEQSFENFSALTLIFWLYLAVCGLMLLRYLKQLLELRKILGRHHFQNTPEGYLLAHTAGNQPTFSFFRYLVINKNHAETPEEYQLLLQHEKAHAQQQHSADVLLAELAQILLWFHPGLYLLNKALRQTHEHLADTAVIKASASEAIYIALMAKQGLTVAGIPFTSTFFKSFTINRIHMIKKNTPTTWHWRIAASLLLSASLTAFVACEKQADPIEQTQVSPSAPQAKVADEMGTASPDASGVFDVTEEEALPADGMAAFYKHLYENINYPKEALDNNVEGTVYIRFVIDEMGNVESAEPIEGRELGYGLDEEAIRVIKTTKWTPAKQRGMVVKQRKILPLKFQLAPKK